MLLDPNFLCPTNTYLREAILSFLDANFSNQPQNFYLLTFFSF